MKSIGRDSKEELLLSGAWRRTNFNRLGVSISTGAYGFVVTVIKVPEVDSVGGGFGVVSLVKSITIGLGGCGSPSTSDGDGDL